MMHGFGDSSEPLIESAKIVEEVVLQQMRTIIKKACEVSERRGNSKKNTCVSAEDLIFLLRKNKVKLQRLIKYLGKFDLNIMNYKILFFPMFFFFLICFLFFGKYLYIFIFSRFKTI